MSASADDDAPDPHRDPDEDGVDDEDRADSGDRGDGSSGREVDDLSDDETDALDAVGAFTSTERSTPAYAELADAFEAVEAFLLGAEPTLTRVQVASRAGVPLELADQLWRWLGFPHAGDDDVAFADSDVEALQMTSELMRMGILGDDSQAALVRTWGRSYARLAEWQTTLLAGLAVEGADPDVRLAELAAGVLPRVEALQSYVWRRHLASAASRLMTTGASAERPEVPLAICFVDIVGYTSQSKNLSESELVEMVERFEQETTDAVVAGQGRVIKTIGDEVLFAAEDVVAAAEIALALTRRGEDEEDSFPSVRAGLAHGMVVPRLGDVFGPTVNVASRLTSIARPGTVVVDRGAHDVLAEVTREAGPTTSTTAGGESREEAGEESAGGGQHDADADDSSEDEPTRPAKEQERYYRLKRLRRLSVKGYSRLEAWSLRPPKETTRRPDRGSTPSHDR